MATSSPCVAVAVTVITVAFFAMDTHKTVMGRINMWLAPFATDADGDKYCLNGDNYLIQNYTTEQEEAPAQEAAEGETASPEQTAEEEKKTPHSEKTPPQQHWGMACIEKGGMFGLFQNQNLTSLYTRKIPASCSDMAFSVLCELFGIAIPEGYVAID